MSMLFFTRLLVSLLLVLPLGASAQRNVEVHQALLDLSHEGVLMDLSAHPDDEDGATLAYYRMKEGVKTCSVLFTRGEGGQNEIGPELYEELGVIRSAETRKAGAILGTEVRFLNFEDFGFSKTATETFRIWGGQTEVLRQLVYTIRTLKPDVLFTNHNTIDGHGNHQAVAITAIAAFDAAGDSTMFPEQLKEPGVTLWQPRKLFFRAFGRYEPIADVSNHILETDSARGLSYIDIATEALRMHRTQGMDRADLRRFTRGKSLYKLVRQNSIYDQDSTDFFSGIEYDLDPAVARLSPVRSELAALNEHSDPTVLTGEISGILTRLDSVQAAGPGSVLARRIVTRWQESLRNLAALLCGVAATVRFDDHIVVARQKVGCVVDMSSTNCTLSGVRYQFSVPKGWTINEAEGVAPEIAGRHVKREFTVIVGDDPRPTLPRAQQQYTPLDLHQDVTAAVTYRADGHLLSVSATPDFDVAPSQLLSVAPPVTRISPSRLHQGTRFTCTVTNFLPHKIAGRIHAEVPRGWTANQAAFAIADEDSMTQEQIVVRPPDTVRSGEYPLRFTTGLASATATVKIFDVSVAPGSTVGVIESYDNTLQSALAELGVTFSLLTDRDLAAGTLGGYSSIIVDIRAYLVRDSLRTHNKRLLDYVRSGGNLIVMYQREQEWKPDYAPYPFRITGRRVTVEDAPVRILQPEHPLLNKPNRITPGDWDGWVQERGLHFPGDVSPEYVLLVATGDPDEAPLTTGYLVANAGKGSYIYSSLVWYRQLKEDNPGAFRCFANMISYPAYRH